MSDKSQEENMINQFIEWGNQQDDIRALILTSSRTTPLGTVDALSDYDMIIVTTDIMPYYEQHDWLSAFGTVLALFRDPVEDDEGLPSSGYVVQFEGTLKIDVTLWQVEKLKQVVAQPELPDEFDAGYRVILDKDNLTRGLKPPTYQAYIPKPPTEQEYQETIEVFFVDTMYVAKFLWRDDILAAKELLDHFIKHEHMIPMLVWHLEIEHGWTIKPGLHGQRLKKHLRADLWDELLETFTGANIDANWDALYRSIALFRKVAIEVGEHFGYAYPDELEQRVRVNLQKVRNLDSNAESLG